VTVHDGTVLWNSTGTLATATCGERGRLDFSEDPRAKSVTNPIESYSADPVNDPGKVVSSLVIDFNGVSPVPAWGSNFKMTRAATT
jgi:hypothetical protein